MSSSSILQIKKLSDRDDYITSQQYHTYTPYTPSYNHNDEVRIAIQSQDLYVLPSESYLHIEFTIQRRDGVDAQAAIAAQFSYLFLGHLFSEMRYELNGFEIDRCRSPGTTSLMKCLVATKLTDKYAFGLYALNSHQNIQLGTYRMILPLRFVFGFCEDFSKIVLNSKHELILIRNRSDLNLFTSNVDNISFRVDKIHWKMPHISLSDGAKLSLLKTLDRKDDIPITFRSWDLYELPVIPQTTRHNWSVKTTTQMTKPRYVIVGFQTNKNFVVGNNISHFDNCNISDVKLHINNERYPYDNLNLNFDEMSYHELYLMFLKIQQSYYNGTSAFNPFELDFASFRERPLFAFDCSRSDESIKSGMVDVRVEIHARENIPALTSAYCLIIHDNLIRYSPFSSIVHRDI